MRPPKFNGRWRLRPWRAQAIDEFAGLENVDRNAIGPVDQELAGVSDRLGFTFECAGLFEGLSIGVIDSEVERTHGENIAQRQSLVAHLAISVRISSKAGWPPKQSAAEAA